MYSTLITLLLTLIASIQNIEIREIQKYLHLQRHLQSINSTEANQAYGTRNKIRGVNE